MVSQKALSWTLRTWSALILRRYVCFLVLLPLLNLERKVVLKFNGFSAVVLSFMFSLSFSELSSDYGLGVVSFVVQGDCASLIYCP